MKMTTRITCVKGSIILVSPLAIKLVSTHFVAFKIASSVADSIDDENK